jgi:hypothetical protein
MMIFSYPEDTFSLDKLKYKIDDLTDPVLEYVEEFTNVLKKSKKTIINRLNKNEPFRRSNPD